MRVGECIKCVYVFIEFVCVSSRCERLSVLSVCECCVFLRGWVCVVLSGRGGVYVCVE